MKFELNFQELDPEAKIGLVPQKYTAVSAIWSFFLGLLFTAIFYGALYPLHMRHKYQMVDMFFHGGAENRSSASTSLGWRMTKAMRGEPSLATTAQRSWQTSTITLRKAGISMRTGVNPRAASSARKA